MSHRYTAAAVIALSLGFAGCAAHGPGDVAYDTHRVSAPATGGTSSTAGGSVSGGTEQGEKEQRGNTPPGVDRDGHGPAAGAIVDPTGAATGRKP